MNSHREGMQKTRGGVALAILAMVALFAVASRSQATSPHPNTNPNSNAKSKPTDVPARVIAHLPLASQAGNQMVLQRLGNKRYLYIQQASKQGYIIVEVTKPEIPTFVKRQASSGDSTAGKLEIVGDNVAVAAIPDAADKTAIRSTPGSTATVRILDLSDPAHPTTLQTFKNVTSILADGGHGIIYLTNDEGLWVLKHNREPFTLAKKKPCDSYSAIAAMPPDCE